MIQVQTYLNVADNTGAQKVMCIQVLGSKQVYANVGDIIMIVVKMRLNFFIFENFNFYILI